MEFHVVVSTLMLSFYICYVGYYLFPASSPCSPSTTSDISVSGVLFYDYVRSFRSTGIHS
jgi:hypothetical protein